MTKESIQYWLVKSEADCYSIDDFKKDGKTAWTGIRNYQARNFMRDNMKIGDGVLFYHSSGDENGIYGRGKVCSLAHADMTALDKKDEHFDPKSTKENPIWTCVDLEFVEKFSKPVPLGIMKINPKLSRMITLKRGNRLSVTPVTQKEFEEVVRIGQVK